MAHSTGVRHSRKGDRIRKRMMKIELKEKLEKELKAANSAKTETTRLKHEAVAADIRAAIRRMSKKKR